ncbi:hypothetical protein JTE90_019202 [Oedothorax gibbosus]|uniref:Uncharacterized protein n=1 Tax=Oedothorax gibbosus TaxID=931172 RepID=A0AAV6TNS5_9ARAC|nr:hypothetical protein JTE90_019202 [Oedothorax gibbosus]
MRHKPRRSVLKEFLMKFVHNVRRQIAVLTESLIQNPAIETLVTMAESQQEIIIYPKFTVAIGTRDCCIQTVSFCQMVRQMTHFHSLSVGKGTQLASNRESGSRW